METLRKELYRAQMQDPDKDKVGLAKAMYPGVSRNNAITKLNRLLEGKSKYIEIDLVSVICNYLDINPNKLFDYEK